MPAPGTDDARRYPGYLGREGRRIRVILPTQKVQLRKIGCDLGRVDPDAAVSLRPLRDSALDQFGRMVAILSAGGGVAPMSAIMHADCIEHVCAKFADRRILDF